MIFSMENNLLLNLNQGSIYSTDKAQYRFFVAHKFMGFTLVSFKFFVYNQVKSKNWKSKQFL